jgi:hypothetical protein
MMIYNDFILSALTSKLSCHIWVRTSLSLLCDGSEATGSWCRLLTSIQCRCQEYVVSRTHCTRHLVVILNQLSTWTVFYCSIQLLLSVSHADLTLPMHVMMAPLVKTCSLPQMQKSYPRNRPWRPTGLRDVKDPTLFRQSAHRWR